MLTKTSHPEAIEPDTSDEEVVIVRRKKGQNQASAAPIVPASRLADALGTALVIACLGLATGWGLGTNAGESSAKAKIEASERSAAIAKLTTEKLAAEKAQFCQGAKP